MVRRLSDYNEFLTAVLKSVTENVEFRCSPPLSEIIKNPRLVVILNHATPLSWIPAIGLLTSEFVKAGGGDRKPLGIADKWLFSNPLTRPLAQYLTQCDRHLNFEELIEKFHSEDHADLALMPEGANTFFGDNFQIQKFRSPKFIEIAVRSEAPLLIVVHKGTENWSLPLQLPVEWAQYVLPFSQFFGQRLQNAEPINIPLIPHKIPRFAMACELYRPDLKIADLNQDPVARMVQLGEEAEKIRAVMNRLLDSFS